MSDGLRVNEAQQRIHSWAKEKGWTSDLETVLDACWRDFAACAPESTGQVCDDCESSLRLTAALVAEKLALIHSEVSEALEDLRGAIHPCNLNDWTATDGNGKPVGFASELADIHIRVWNLEAILGIDSEDSLRRKMDYNDTREYKHGGKLM